MKDRDEEALRALKTLRGPGMDMTPEEELEVIRVSLQEESDSGSYADLFRGHNRRRTLVVLGVAFFFQATGNSFTGHFSGIYVKSLGSINPLNVTVAQTAINTFTAFLGIIVIDRIGRRTLWLAGSVFLLAVLLTTGALGVNLPISYPRKQGIVATLLMYGMAYSATVAPLYYTLVTEIPASRLRDKTVRLAATVNIVTM